MIIERSNRELAASELHRHVVRVAFVRTVTAMQEDRAGGTVGTVHRERIVRDEDQFVADVRVAEALSTRIAGLRMAT